MISDSVAESISSQIKKKERKRKERGISWKRLERGHKRFGYGTNSTLAHPLPFLHDVILYRSLATTSLCRGSLSAKRKRQPNDQWQPLRLFFDPQARRLAHRRRGRRRGRSCDASFYRCVTWPASLLFLRFNGGTEEEERTGLTIDVGRGLDAKLAPPLPDQRERDLWTWKKLYFWMLMASAWVGLGARTFYAGK